MNENIYYIFGAIIMVIAVFAIVTGVKSVLAEGKKVWSMLQDSFGVSNEDFTETSGDTSAPGKLELLNQEFVGGASIVDQGIIFRQDFMSRHELVLFPWDKIRDFKTEKAERFTATFFFDKEDGSPQTVQIPWSDDLERRAAAFPVSLPAHTMRPI